MASKSYHFQEILEKSGNDKKVEKNEMKKGLCCICFITVATVVFLLFIFVGKIFKGDIVQENAKFNRKPVPRIIQFKGHPIWKSKPLSKIESSNIKKCKQKVGTYLKKSMKSWENEGGDKLIHKSYKSYLTNGSTVIIVGGNLGDEADYILNTFKPKTMIILEPVLAFYLTILDRFRGHSSVVVLNIGLGAETDTAYANIKGPQGLETSIFHSKKLNNEQVNIINATEFFQRIGIGYFYVDLLAIDCEGCEYDVLEALTRNTLAKYFKRIQFQIHCPVHFGYNIKNAHIRYCEIQERLKRSHKVYYQFSYFQEMWQIKN